ncbi:hypothetical protein KFL_009190010, partial [Klebsormidium nitens]
VPCYGPLLAALRLCPCATLMLSASAAPPLLSLGGTPARSRACWLCSWSGGIRLLIRVVRAAWPAAKPSTKCS